MLLLEPNLHVYMFFIRKIYSCRSVVSGLKNADGLLKLVRVKKIRLVLVNLIFKQFLYK